MLNRFEEEGRERELELLNATVAANQEKISLQHSQQIIIIIFAFLLVIVGFGLRNRIRVIRRTKAKLEEINQQLEDEKKRAEKSERFKEKFLTNVSHEIRTPMNAIMGITNLLIKKKHYKDQETYLEAMSISAKHLLGLINAILDLSKLEAGKVNLEESVFSIDEICNSIHDELKQAYSRKGLYFKISVDKKIPEFLKGDTKMLYQVLNPLCRNGIEFCESGGIYLMAKLIGLTEKMAIIGFTVKDTGVGIRKEFHNKLFSQLIGEVEFDKQQIESSGLELVLIKQMIELQGGSISIDSQPGRGTTFYFEIPYSISDKAQKQESPKKTEPATKVSGLNILLVEDNEFNIMVAQDELQSAIENVAVDVAVNGKIAVEKVKANDYDIVLMDVQMPVMNGYEATAAIRKIAGPKSQIPIIAMTANIMNTEVAKCFESGMNGYIPKPFDTKKLIEELFRNLKKKL
jgi:signal transduction histidine kinase/ActR/RegA family two-component response regulator